MIVEQCARAVGDGLLGEFVQALVGDLDRVLDLDVVGIGDGVGMGDLGRQARPLEPVVTHQRAVLGHRGVQRGRIDRLGQPLHPEHDLHLDRRATFEFLLDVPLAVGGLTPCRPVEGDVGDHAGRFALAGQPVAGLPREVAEQDVGLEVLFERLTFEERRLERVAQRTDRIGEDMVQHVRSAG